MLVATGKINVIPGNGTNVVVGVTVSVAEGVKVFVGVPGGLVGCEVIVPAVGEGVEVFVGVPGWLVGDCVIVPAVGDMVAAATPSINVDEDTAARNRLAMSR